MTARMTLLSVGLVSAIGACGDDPKAAVDARPIDTAVVPPDAPPGVGFMSNEGGEVRFEYVRFANGVADTRAIAYFEAKDDVDFHMYPTIPGCTTVDASKIQRAC